MFHLTGLETKLSSLEWKLPLPCRICMHAQPCAFACPTTSPSPVLGWLPKPCAWGRWMPAEPWGSWCSTDRHLPQAALPQPWGLVPEPRVSCVLLSAAGVVSAWGGKKFSSAFLKLKCKTILIWAFYRLGNIFSLSGFILEQFTWYISWSCIAGVAFRYLMLHKLLWNKKTLFPMLMFYIQFAIKQKTCKLNSCFPHKLEEIWK